MREHLCCVEFSFSNYFIIFLTIDWYLLIFRFKNNINNSLKLHYPVIKLTNDLKCFCPINKFEFSSSELREIIKFYLYIINAKLMCFI